MLNGVSPKLVCFDFDQTMTVQHTYNYFLKKKILPRQLNEENKLECFNKCGVLNRALTRAAIETAITNGHLVAITSYTIYPEMILFTLKKIGLSENIISKVKIITGLPINENQLSMEVVQEPYEKIGKRLHIQKAIQWGKEQGFQIENENIILVDDSEKNINVAKEDGHKTILVPQRKREEESKLSREELKLYQERIKKERQNYLFQLNEHIGNFSPESIATHEEEIDIYSHNSKLLNRLFSLRYQDQKYQFYTWSRAECIAEELQEQFLGTFLPMNDRAKEILMREDPFFGPPDPNLVSEILEVIDKPDTPKR